MRFDADAAAFHQAMKDANIPRFETMNPAAARLLLMELRKRAPVTTQLIAQVADLSAGNVPLRLYKPADGILPVCVFFHGGGWVLGDLDTHDALCRALAHASGCAILAVDYRLAPEHRFPAAVEDVATAIRWIARNGADLGLDPSRLAVMGDSAGGNLAAVAALMARDGDLPPITLQILIYPALDMSLSQPSHRLNIDGLALTGPTMAWFRDHYLADSDGADWRASPLQANCLSGVAPCVIVTVGIDPLCDEGLAYAARLAADGVRFEHRHYPGQIHGFLTASLALPTAQAELVRIAQSLSISLMQTSVGCDGTA